MRLSRQSLLVVGPRSSLLEPDVGREKSFMIYLLYLV